MTSGEYGVAMTEQSPESPLEAPDTATADVYPEAGLPDDGQPDGQPGDAAAEDAYPDDAPQDGPSIDPDGQVRTGNVTVDAVLGSLEGLEDRPVSEHVEVFEHAHEQLRRALDGAGDPADR